jgi:hypothetical protein
MRSAGWLVVVAGCGFHGTAAPAQDPPPADAGLPDSAATVVDAGPAPDAMRSTFCAIDGIVACFEFEGTASDGSGNMLDPTTSNVSFHPGHLGMAMQIDPNGSAAVNPTILDNVTAVTIEAWVRPTQRPASGKQFNVLDVDQQYAFTINDDGTLTCDLRGLAKFSTTPPSGAIPTNQWSHVACTYDGANVAHVYVNGTIVATHNGSGALSKGGHGIGIAQNYPNGAPLIGLIDQLRLLRVARSSTDICTDAGNLLCVGIGG